MIAVLANKCHIPNELIKAGAEPGATQLKLGLDNWFHLQIHINVDKSFNKQLGNMARPSETEQLKKFAQPPPWVQVNLLLHKILHEVSV